jgi:D-amino-acid oxidase
VVVVAADAPPDTVSAVAGGLWSPFRAGPPAAVARWSRAGFDAYAQLADAVPAAAVRLVDVVLVVEDDAREHPWEACAPRPGRAAAPAERPPRVGAARVLRVPFVVDTARHHAWLEARLAAAGGRVVRRRLQTLDAAWELAPAVVACPGLAARELFGDPSVVALRGVVVEVAFAGAGALPALLDERGAQPTYVLPRTDGTVLLGGGSTRATSAPPRPRTRSPTSSTAASRSSRRWPTRRVLRARAGLRPGRPDVRVEAVAHPRGRLVANYGHGGSGWTLAPGCAADVVALLGRSA